jgi:glycosyltransferase involved in cell wall biosynthesis
LLQLIRRLGPVDLIHGHSSKGGTFARLAARRLGVPSVYTPHAMVTLDPTLVAWQRGLYKRIERWLARMTEAIIAVSDDEADHIRSLGIDSRKLHVVPNGIERPAFPPRDEVRSRLGISPREVVIGFVGRLTPQKAPDLLIDAFAMAFAQRADVRLLMVGSGPLESEVRRRVEQRGLSSSRVTLLGDVVGTTIMPAFDVFCLSSRYEGMPYVYLEALAAGLPIVSTRVCGAITCVEPKRNGLIVPPGDAHALSDALATLSADAALRRRYGAASETLAAQFTASQMVDQTLRVYSRVLMDKFDASRMPVIFPWSRFEGRKRGSRQTGVAPPHR